MIAMAVASQSTRQPGTSFADLYVRRILCFVAVMHCVYKCICMNACMPCHALCVCVFLCAQRAVFYGCHVLCASRPIPCAAIHTHLLSVVLTLAHNPIRCILVLMHMF